MGNKLIFIGTSPEGPPPVSSPGGKYLKLVDDYSYHFVIKDGHFNKNNEFAIVIPRGFKYDNASIPRFLWSIVAPFDLGPKAPLLHDYLYVHQGKLPLLMVFPYRVFTRKEADQMFLAIMKSQNIRLTRRITAFRAVRLFGRKPWKKSSSRKITK